MRNKEYETSRWCSFAHIDACNGEFISIVDTIPEIPSSSSLSLSQQAGAGRLGQISLTLISGKQREFMFDYVFDMNSSQDSVYDRIARPVVTDVLKGLGD